MILKERPEFNTVAGMPLWAMDVYYRFLNCGFRLPVSGGTASGLAFRILEAGYQLKIPRMFAALVMVSMSGIVIFLILSFISHLLLRRWHESAVTREN